MIVCNRCGKENQDHYKFCLGCGAELTSPAKPGGDIAVMKTMMADASALRPQGGTPSPYGNLPPPGPGAPLGGPGGMPGMGPGPLPPPPGMAPMGGSPGLNPPPGMGPRPPSAPLGGMPGGPVPGPMGGMPGSGPMGGMPGSGPMGNPSPFGGMPGGPLGQPQQPYGMPGGPAPGPLGGMPGAPPNMGPPAGPPPGVPAPMGGPGFPSPGFPPTPSAQMGAMGGMGNVAAPQPMGAAPASGNRRCPQCNTDVPPSFRFCGACGFRMDEVSAPVAAPAGMPMAAPTPAVQRATLTLIRPDGTEGGVHELKPGENKIGRQFGTIFENDGYLSPTHAELIVGVTQGVVRDLGSLNGVFVKMTEEEEIMPGQVFRIGQELLRFDLVTPPDPMPDGTEVMGSPNPGYWGKVTVIIGKEVDGSAYPLLGENITMGRERGEINFPDDGYVSGLHAKVVTRDGKVYLSDMGSSNGTFFKIAGERQLRNESFVLLGQQLFRLNL